MMKCLSFLLFVAAAQAFVTKEVRDSQRLAGIPAPTFSTLHVFERPVLACTIGWNPVVSSGEPILGYRLIIREEVRPNTNQYQNFQEVFIYGAEKSIAAVAEIRQGLWYEYRIQAFTVRGYGPLSLRNGFLIHERSSTNGERQGQLTYTLMENSENVISA